MKFLRIVCMCSYHPSSEPVCSTVQDIVDEKEGKDLEPVYTGLNADSLTVGEKRVFVHHLPDKYKLDSLILVRIE